ncbi:MAG: class I SAM-dependent methyltransferase [Chitinophagaceae bacterium]|nr:class I SAM-dependent methyltransferase [Chitinophagaceae bacterium]
MPDLIHYTKCPACYSASIYAALSAKDYTVSQQVFEIWHCEDCTLRFTQDVPAAEAIGAYYQSADYVSHSDTQKGLINLLYHRVRKHTLNTKRQLLQEVTGRSSGALLDVGAGTGAFVNTMMDAGWKITGLEPDTTARQNAAIKYGLQLRPSDELYGLQENQFDLITLWHVLEHVHDLHGYLEKFYALLKPGGKLVIAVPNYTSYDAKRYGGYWAAYDVPRHLYHFSPKSMRLLAESKGFRAGKLYPMWYDSYYVAMLSEKYRSGTGNLPGAVWTGFLSNIKAARDPKRCSSVIYTFSKPEA